MRLAVDGFLCASPWTASVRVSPWTGLCVCASPWTGFCARLAVDGFCACLAVEGFCACLIVDGAPCAYLAVDGSVRASPWTGPRARPSPWTGSVRVSLCAFVPLGFSARITHGEGGRVRVPLRFTLLSWA